MIRKQTVWIAYCEGCLAEYGQPFRNEHVAAAFIKARPLCPNCDGENY